MSSPEPMVDVADLHFRYAEGDFALSIPALRVAEGETLAVIGPSGSGKTTLLNLVAGIERPSRGRVLTRGTDLAALDEAARRDFRIRHLGLVFQEFELLEYLDVLDNILLPYHVSASLRLSDGVRTRARRLAEQLDIAHQLRRLPVRLSQGERQRTAVCRALVTAPALLLADEPTGNLDPTNKQRVLERLFECVRETGTTLVAVTHDRELLGRFARVIDAAELAAGAAA